MCVTIAMLTILSERPDEIQQFCANPWPFQRTFLTPLKDLNRFVTTCLSAFPPLEEGSFSTDQVVFEPTHILELLTDTSIEVENWYQLTLKTEGAAEIARLLESILADPVDFFFVPKPSSFAIYADHDEYTTFYANEKPRLESLVMALEKAGFPPVADYIRSSGPSWR
jgi:hypothetical protein